MKVQFTKMLFFVIAFTVMTNSITALAAQTPPPLSVGSKPQVAAERLVQDKSVWVSLPDPVNLEDVISFKKTVQAYVDAVSMDSETPVVKMTVWRKPDDNRAQMVLETTSEASQFTEDEIELMSEEAGDTVVSINAFIRNHLSYDTEAATKGKDLLTLSSPQLTAKGGLSAGRAVCQGYANLFALLSDYAGIKSVKVRGYIGDAFHVMNAVQMDEGVMAVDTTFNDSLNKDWALLIPMETYCKQIGFCPIIDPETALTLKYGS